MQSSEKKTILILIIVGIIIIGGLLIWSNHSRPQNNYQPPIQSGSSTNEEYVQNLQDGGKLNISDELRKTKQLDGLEITNIQLKEIGGITTLLADVENKTGKQTAEKKVIVDIVDKDGQVLTSLKGIIDPIAVGGTVQLNAAVTADVANAYDFRISNR